MENDSIIKRLKAAARRFMREKLHRHVYGSIPIKDCSWFEATCKHCGYEWLIDSQGNEF